MPRVADTRHLPRKYTTQAEQYRIPLQQFAPDFTVQAAPPPQAFAGARILPAATGPATVTKPKEDKFQLQWSEDWQPGNCGMRVISSISGYFMHFFETEGRWLDHTTIPFLVSDLWKELDKRFFLRDNVVGQVLITDGIVGLEFYNMTPKLDDKIERFQACHLVQYILARKLGTIFRGPVTRNPRYADHIIVSWIWIPNPEWLVKSDPKVFNEPAKYSGETAALAKETEALKVLEHEEWINENVVWPPVT